MLRSTRNRLLQAVAGCLALAAAGCQSGDGAGALTTSSAPTPAEGKILQSELVAYCPAVLLREGTAYFNSYARGGEGDPSKVIHQGAIAEVTRSCSRVDGSLTIDVAAAGRVVPGPLAKPGTVTMPIRVVVLRGSEILYTKLHKFPVDVATIDAATQFVFNDPNVVIPVPSEQNIQVFVGFDEGPPPKAS
ncbi:MAG: hypothetical protein JNL61_20220 [Rhizobiaceae bacterium]|nr:hypothetical protein [Rhizobiaceae bacterium]